MAADDLEILDRHLRDAARIESNGEVCWEAVTAPDVINALAASGRLVLGLDVRTYDSGGTVEVPLSDVGGQTDVLIARDAALAALSDVDSSGWIVVTWK